MGRWNHGKPSHWKKQHTVTIITWLHFLQNIISYPVSYFLHLHDMEAKKSQSIQKDSKQSPTTTSNPTQICTWVNIIFHIPPLIINTWVYLSSIWDHKPWNIKLHVTGDYIFRRDFVCCATLTDNRIMCNTSTATNLTICR